MARQVRERDDLGYKVADLLSAHADVRTQAADDLTDAKAADPPLTVAVLRTPSPEPLNPWLLPHSVLTTVWQRDHVLLIPASTNTATTLTRARRLLEERHAPVQAGLYSPAPPWTTSTRAGSGPAWPPAPPPRARPATGRPWASSDSSAPQATRP